MKNLKINYKADNCSTNIKEFILDYIKKNNKNNIVLLCLGSDEGTGTSFAPLIGTLLHKHIPISIFGILDNPVTKQNLKEILEIINRDYNTPLIIVIDGVLGKTEDIGFIEITDNSLTPYSYEDISIKCLSIISTLNEGDSISALKNTRLNLVFAIAQIIVDGITNSMKE